MNTGFMRRTYLAVIALIVTSIVLAVPVVVALQTSSDSSSPLVSQNDVRNRLPTILLSHPGTVEQRDAQEDTANNTGPGFMGAPRSSNTSLLPFAHIPPSNAERAEPGVDIYKLSGSDRVRVEVYMGEQPDTGHSVQITGITKNENTVTVNAIFRSPAPIDTDDTDNTYPADAVEFTLPDGAYTVHVKTLRFDHDTGTVTIN